MRSALLVVAHVSAFLVGSVAWIGVLGVGMAIAFALAGRTIQTTADLGPLVLGAMAMLQSVGMVALAAFLSRALPMSSSADPSVAGSFPPGGLDRWLLVGGLAGSVGWIGPSWLADQLTGWFGPGALDLVTAGLTSPDLVGRVVLSVAIALGAPLLEELVFRGYLWRVFEGATAPGSAAGAWGAAVGTTLLFCAWHADPVQSTALLPTAALFAWLRWRSGGVAAPIAAHFANNAAGVLLAGQEVEITLAHAAAGFAAVGALVAISEGSRWRAR